MATSSSNSVFEGSKVGATIAVHARPNVETASQGYAMIFHIGNRLL